MFHCFSHFSLFVEYPACPFVSIPTLWIELYGSLV